MLLSSYKFLFIKCVIKRGGGCIVQPCSISKTYSVQYTSRVVRASEEVSTVLKKERYFCPFFTKKVGGGGGGAKSYDGEKAWSSINHSILTWCRKKYAQAIHTLTIFLSFTITANYICLCLVLLTLYRCKAIELNMGVWAKRFVLQFPYVYGFLDKGCICCKHKLGNSVNLFRPFKVNIRSKKQSFCIVILNEKKLKVASTNLDHLYKRDVRFLAPEVWLS